MDRNSDASLQAVAVFLGLAGAAHLARKRYFDSLVPDRIDPLRREIEITTGTLQLAGALALFVPRLRQTTRWVHVSMQVVTLVAAVDNMRHPERTRGRRSRVDSVDTFLTGAQIPPRVAAIGLIWWATRPRSGTQHA